MNSNDKSEVVLLRHYAAAFVARDPAGSLGIAAAFLEPGTKPSPDLERPLVRLGRFLGNLTPNNQVPGLAPI
jgi:hypothetical protein